MNNNIHNNILILFLLSLQLRNIQSMIRLTKGNLEALNARFSEYQHPPSMYITVSMIFSNYIVLKFLFIFP